MSLIAWTTDSPTSADMSKSLNPPHTGRWWLLLQVLPTVDENIQLTLDETSRCLNSPKNNKNERGRWLKSHLDTLSPRCVAFMAPTLLFPSQRGHSPRSRPTNPIEPPKQVWNTCQGEPLTWSVGVWFARKRGRKHPWVRLSPRMPCNPAEKTKQTVMNLGWGNTGYRVGK